MFAPYIGLSTHLWKEDDEGERFERVAEEALEVRDRRVQQLLGERRVRLEGAALRPELQERTERRRTRVILVRTRPAGCVKVPLCS